MYIDLIRRVLEEAVETYASTHGMAVSEVLTAIREHINSTAKEHQKDEPDIKYEDALCRLGYLYRHATANATLFELVLTESGEMRSLLRQCAGQRLNICAVGGGPGTELLGLAKYLLRHPERFPKKVVFTLLDSVPQWAETWQQLADAVEAELQRVTEEDEDITTYPTIAPAFLPLDVLDANSYKSYAYQFSGAQVIAFNYLFSENKARLADAKDAVAQLSAMAPKGCIFVVIDRLENNRCFQAEVVRIFRDVFGREIPVHTFNGTLDGDEQTRDMGELFNTMLGNPRVKFFTDIYRAPTVFWFTVVKE
jgi:hypothetical protein